VITSTANTDEKGSPGSPGSPAYFLAWERVRDGRSFGKWKIAATGETEQEAFRNALAPPLAGIAHRDLLVLPRGEQP
jgi:hypothetical protein